MENLVVETVCALYTIMTKGKQLKNCEKAIPFYNFYLLIGQWRKDYE